MNIDFSERQTRLYDECEKYDLVYRKPSWADYPPYVRGSMYFEQWINHVMFRLNPTYEIQTDRLFLPIHWTAAYKDGVHLQEILDKILSKDEKYYTISTHDDAPRERIPNNLSFSAGGLKGDIPIPLIVCPIQTKQQYDCSKKDIFCSFKGSITHPIRYKMEKVLGNHKDYIIETGMWKEEIKPNEETRFLDLMARSTFALCPRGYGATSYRLYESFQMDSIPVYITDKFWLPFEDKLDWTEFCVLVPEEQIDNIDLILKSYSESDIQRMKQKGKEVWRDYFTYKQSFYHIREILKNENKK